MFELPLFRSTRRRTSPRQRLGKTWLKPGLEQLERRELLDSGLGSLAGLDNATSARLITGLYYDLLHRAPEASEVAAWVAGLHAGQRLEDIARAFISSPEYLTNSITDNYTSVLRREPVTREISSWLQPMAKGLSEEQLVSQFLAADEYYGQQAGNTAENWLTGLYRNLLERAPDAAGFFLWKEGLQNGASRATVALGFVTSPEADTRFVAASYQHLLGRDPDLAGETAWVADLRSGMTQSDVTANIVGSVEYFRKHTAVGPDGTKPIGGASSVYFDFGTGRSLVAPGSTGVPLVSYGQQRGYGWESLSGLGFRDRGTSDPLTSSFHYGQDGTFRVDLPDGAYAVTVTLGDAQASHGDMAIWAQGQQVVAGLTTAPGQFIGPAFNVQVTNGELELHITTTGAVGTYFAINGLDITPVTSPVSNGGPDLTPTQTQQGNSFTTTPTLTNTPANTGQGTGLLADHNVPPTVVINGAPPSSPPRTPIALTSTVTAQSPVNTAAHVHYAWNVAKNGSPFASATTANLTFTPDTSGTYVVTLTATDQAGAAGTDTKIIIVPISVSPPVANAGPDVVTDEGKAVLFAGSVTGGTVPYTYAWSFGNGGTASGTLTPTYSYLDHGYFTVTLTVTDALGNAGQSTLHATVNDMPPTATINGAPATSPEGVPVALTSTVTVPSPTDLAAGFRYAWSATKDGSPFASASSPFTSATTPNFNFTPVDHGTYVVTLVVTDKDNATGTATKTITVTDVAPLVGISGAPATSPEGIPIALTSNVFSPSPADIAAGFRYAWSVTKNQVAYASATTATFSFTPNDDATYAVTLTVTDRDNATGTDTKTITVPDAGPTANANGPYTGTPGTAINFTGTATDPSSVDTAAGFTYAWTFGDGGTSNLSTPSHTYSAAGSYTVTLTVTDKDGASNGVTTAAVVSIGLPPGDFITTPYDKIPNFGAHPNIVSATSGSWSNVSTWSLGRLPTSGDVVSINANTTVTYDVMNDAPLNTIIIQSGGHLNFRTDVSTKVVVVNLLVLEGGELHIGDAANPVAPNVKAEVVIADQPIDTTKDPAQYGHGLIGLGKVTMYGAVKNQTFVNLATEPKAGDVTLTLSQPVTGWGAGDKLILPDTRQLRISLETGSNYVSQSENLALASVSIDGLTLTLSKALQFAHLGARDGNGTLTFLPHVGNLGRNVMIHSQSATGTRGSVTFTYHADVDVRYVGFYGLGRTKINPLDSTTFDASGNVTHIGTNERGRYPVYFDHLVGPAAAPADGYQYTFVGNSIFCPLDPMPFRWGLAINDSHYGLVQDNVLDNWAGAGLVTESGNESFNVIAHNFVVDVMNQDDTVGTTWDRADGRGQGDLGTEGVGFWFRGFNNYVRDNVAANAGSYGYTYFAEYVDQVKVPLLQGADISVAGQYRTINMNATPILEFARNEAYGATPSGMTIWWLGRGLTVVDPGESLIKDFHVWNVHQQGFFAYEMNHVTFDGLVVRGDFGILARYGEGGAGYAANDYFTPNLLIRNADIQGMSAGFVPSTNSGNGTQTIESSYLRNYMNVYVDVMWTSSYRSDGINPRTIIVRDDTFAAPILPNPQGPNYDIYMDGSLSPGEVANLVQSDQLFVYNYNKTVGDNFQVYYTQQSPTYVLPQSTYNADGSTQVTASPEAGLSNQQNWLKYHIAFAGAIAPTSATRARINGFVQPM